MIGETICRHPDGHQQRAIRLVLFFLILIRRKVEHIAAVGLDAIILFLGTNDKFVKLTQTSSCGYQVTTDNVLLHTLQAVNLTTDSGLVEHLGCLLE